ncbi:hypothetical protein [Streptomyces silvensis]|uniref:Uncharacterized protein n=1 Tax=Streptomyces silvensis TaxID=1765722 RepID=A0A0W7X7X0_9ACTN|nr:hypothetical protein [Streptomyces silvensis]KUF18826.1 hypothetical protein AT728_07260 [Streptomyces silvensis]
MDKLVCTADPCDTLSVSAKYGDIAFRADRAGNAHHTVFATPADARAFARTVLRLAGEDGGEKPTADETPEPSPIKVGDRVVVVEDDPFHRTGEFVGAQGTVDELDVTDPDQPFLVRFDAPMGVIETWWCAEVRRIGESPAEPEEALTPAQPTFADRIKEAKRLLRGTPHTGADIIHLAEILAAQA